ncbi:MAG: hypothetical protein E7Z90_06980 [Cyanobacteria bacterium SIG29]|nr:hypothetical protein [Cyanobacteria bacterium SIG29]
MSENYYNIPDELDEELTIDLKKIALAIWNNKFLIIKVFVVVFCLMILSTFVLPKKYKVESDLYINKSNNSHMAEINPYFISEVGVGSGMAAMLAGGGGALTNELEIMQSPLVIEKVIKENDLRFKKVFGIIPTIKTGKYLTVEAFLKKGPKFENKKGTNVVSITYKSKDRELAYNVVNSIINNYIDLHKQINSEKSKLDKSVIEKEYQSVKQGLDSKLNKVSGMPSTAMTGVGHLSAMSAYSNSASSAIGTLRSQYIAGERSRIEVSEEAEKVAELAKKLEWARLVEQMSDTSKVLILKEPRLLAEYEQVSPKLFINIVMGIVLGAIFALIALIIAETTSKKLTYSMLGDNILYSLEKDFTDLQIDLLSHKDKKLAVIAFEGFSEAIIQKLQAYKNIKFVKPEISEEFIADINDTIDVITVAKIGETNAKLYKQIKEILKKTNKNIVKEALV